MQCCNSLALSLLPGRLACSFGPFEAELSQTSGCLGRAFQWWTSAQDLLRLSLAQLRQLPRLPGHISQLPQSRAFDGLFDARGTTLPHLSQRMCVRRQLVYVPWCHSSRLSSTSTGALSAFHDASSSARRRSSASG